MADREDDIPLTDEERTLAERGRSIVAAAMAHTDARAPRALRESPAGAQPLPRAARRRARPARPWVLVPALGALAVALVALVVAGPGGGGSAPGLPRVEQIAAVARLPANAPAPARLGGSPALLDARVGRLAFPDWRPRYRWRATGRRSDRVGGRAVSTVSYHYDGRPAIGYAIVAGPPVRSGPGRDVTRRGIRYRVLESAGRRTVTWTQAGHTCVIDAPSTVSAAELVRLASWAT